MTVGRAHLHALLEQAARVPNFFGAGGADGLVNDERIGIAVGLAKVRVERDDAIEVLAHEFEAPVLLEVNAVRYDHAGVEQVGESRTMAERQCGQRRGWW